MAFLNRVLSGYKRREGEILPHPYENRGEVLPSLRRAQGSDRGQEHLLQIDSLSLAFGGLQVLEQVSLSISPDEIHAVIGPNGAGKTSLLNCICRVYDWQAGGVRFEGRDLKSLRPDQVARLGVARTFQQIELFAGMSVMENIMLGRHIFMRGGILRGGLWTPGLVKEEIINRKRSEEVIEFLHLEAYRDVPVGTLSLRIS